MDLPFTFQDISFKLCKAPSQTQRTSITHDSPWKLQQVQDAANHLQTAINHIDDVDDSYHFKWVCLCVCVLPPDCVFIYNFVTRHVEPRMKCFMW